MKRVLFVSDFSLDQAPGGAQISNANIIAKGRELGYEIVEHHHNSSITDFLIFSFEHEIKIKNDTNR